MSLVNVVQETRLVTLFKGENVILIKTSNCENMVLYFSKKVQKFAAFAFFFRFSVTKKSLENGFGFHQSAKIPTLPASLKIESHFSTSAAFGNSVNF